MANGDLLQLNLDELSQATQLSSAIIIEIVEQGIVDPEGTSPDTWRFAVQTVAVAKRAFRSAEHTSELQSRQ